jgi:hypothetical protein
MAWRLIHSDNTVLQVALGDFQISRMSKVRAWASVGGPTATISDWRIQPWAA